MPIWTFARGDVNRQGGACSHRMKEHRDRSCPDSLTRRKQLRHLLYFTQYDFPAKPFEPMPVCQSSFGNCIGNKVSVLANEVWTRVKLLF